MNAHLCVDCAALPKLPDDPGAVDENVEYRPVRARTVVAGETSRSMRCASHQKAFEAAAKASAHDARVARTYGLARGEYAALYAFQGGRCAICLRATGRKRRLAVDHAHDETQEPRGLLCSPCNYTLLGRYGRDALLRAVAYLDDPPLRQMRREAS